jgi:hypothetical protein
MIDRPLHFFGYWVLLIFGITVIPYVLGPLQVIQFGGVFMVVLYVFLSSIPAFLYLNVLGGEKHAATWILRGLLVGILWSLLTFATMYLKVSSAQLSLFFSRLGTLNPFNNTDDWMFYLPMIIVGGLLAGIIKATLVGRSKSSQKESLHE